MINDTRFIFNREQPLDVWINDTLAVINDIMYDVFSRLNQVLNEVLEDVR